MVTDWEVFKSRWQLSFLEYSLTSIESVIARAGEVGKVSD
jgi:hypothetical protein